MFGTTSRTTFVMLAGMALTGAMLAAPSTGIQVTGHAATWGSNNAGQLGNATYTDSTAPVTTGGLLAARTLTAISAGTDNACAVADGRAYCWGDNTYGQLGNSSTTPSSVPVPVDTSGVLAGKTVTAISVRSGHTCGVADGRAYCWGRNDSGQLGNNSGINSTVPVAVDASGVLAGKTVTWISAGSYHTCAAADDQAYCWGSNGKGQLGNNSTAESKVPVKVDTLGALAGTTVTAVDTGALYSCAIADGRAYCWGYNLFGQLGNGTFSDSLTPVAVDGSGLLTGKTVTAISAGAFHSCALAGGRAYCWGNNGQGELGNNSTTESKVPVPVDTSGVLTHKTVTAVSAGNSHSCAVAEGRAYCWGYNDRGQLGNNSTTESKVPLAVDMSGLLNTKTVTMIDAGGYHTAVLFAAVPQPPTGATGVAGDGQVTMSWSPPGDDGGSPIEQYTATATPGGATCSTAGTSCVVAGLSNGTGYTFTVTARNAIGTSIASAPSPPVIPKAPKPGKVTGVKAKVHKGAVTVTWKAVAGATSYRVRISKPGGTKYKAWKTTSKRIFKTKVRKGKKYRFQIAAVNTGGRGPTKTIRFKGK